MGKSLFEFASENKGSNFNENSKENFTSEKQVKETFDKYSKLSSNQLMSELLSEVNRQKRDGTFSFSELAQKIDSIRPMLSDQQIKNLDNLLKQIK